ncbi:Na+/H+ antiporter NhaC family protein [Alkalihalobacterium bogoriense]|uniref:Na+/H+ antiporter NhaC family protein n=1 Tax=Alkalihalobacterium bogoriense TaxID=246272 RepID=UPI00047DA45E|nr:Na+/H+ antiporter NhaC family protein [Alkalihalobacterium bogoriense]
MEGTIYSLIPPVVAIVMVLLTRKVLLSLGVGIISAALLLEQFSPIESLQTLVNSFYTIFVSDGAINTWNVYILLFLLLLGMITAFITVIGGSRAFGEWALRRVKTRVGAQIVTAILGVIIFIDDYFNALAVGQVSRPLTDRHNVSRAKLAYIIDSTSAPICVVSPISSWGAYIIGIIGTILTYHHISDYSSFTAFIQMIPMNYYVILSILFVFVTATCNINIGPMKKHELRAIQTGQTFSTERGKVPGELKEDLPVSQTGSVLGLIVPIMTLIVATVTSMIYLGYQESGSGATILDVFANTDPAAALLYGGIVTVVITFLFFVYEVSVKKALPFQVSSKASWQGIQSMLPAIYILILAWMIVDLIDQLETGTFLASIIEQSNFSVALLPVILFILAGIMAFSTGTSWGTFGLMLPIAGQIMVIVEPSLLLPSLAAVLAGAVFGDHCSPISDTTILSSTGAGCHHIDHVVTQLPYAIIAAILSSVGYIVLGVTGSVWFGLIISLLLFGLIIGFLIRYSKHS